jgi:uncharacterized phosphosugar-binding protein
VRDHLEAAERANAAVLEAVARRLCEVVRSDGLVYVAGTGHSLALVLESFYRAGGLACVYPIYHPALLPLAGGAASTLAERVAGFGRALVEGVPAGPSDLAFVFSHSGVNPVPVEIAEVFKAKGAPVIGVVSRDHMRRAPIRHPRKLDQVADLLIDTLVPYGDAVYDAGAGVPTMPLSSLSGVFVWNLLLVRLADLAREEGAVLPLWTSANVEGGEARNRELLARYRPRIPQL